MEDWREKFLLGAENALRTRPKDEEALKDEQIKKLKQKIGELVLDNDILREALETVPFRPEDIRRVRAALSGVSERRSCRVLAVGRASLHRMATDWTTPGGPGPALGRATPAVDSAVSHLRLSTSLGIAAWPDGAPREQEGGVSGAKAEAVVGPSAVVYTPTTRARLGEPSQSER